MPYTDQTQFPSSGPDSTHAHVSLPQRCAELKRASEFARERWYDIDDHSAQWIAKLTENMSDRELHQHPMLAVSGAIALSLLNHRDHHGERYASFLERLAGIAQAAPQHRFALCAYAREYWTMLRSVMLRVRHHYSAAALVSQSAASVSVSSCTCHEHPHTRNPALNVPCQERYSLSHARPGLAELQRSLNYAFSGCWSQALMQAVRAAQSGGSQPRSQYAAVYGNAVAALLHATLGYPEEATAHLNGFYRSSSVPLWCVEPISQGALIARVLLNLDHEKDTPGTDIARLEQALKCGEVWPFAAHALNRIDLRDPQTCWRVEQRLDDLRVKRNIDVRAHPLIGRLLHRDFLDAVLQGGMGNRVLRHADSHSALAADHIPLAHMWLRLGEANTALKHAQFAFESEQNSHREKLEARLLLAAAHTMNGKTVSGGEAFRTCSAEVLRDFPYLFRLLPPQIFSQLRSVVQLVDTGGTSQQSPVPHPRGCPDDSHLNYESYLPVSLVRVTKREREILLHLQRGQTPHDIAVADVVSPHTVRSQLKMMYKKLRVRSATEAVSRATELGILAPAGAGFSGGAV